MTLLERITAILEHARIAGGWMDDVVAAAVLAEVRAAASEAGMIDAAASAIEALPASTLGCPVYDLDGRAVARAAIDAALNDVCVRGAAAE